jgi:16S rRNA (guanine(1405)-N(7))-methyltransferase
MNLDAVVRETLRSRRYRWVAPELVARLARDGAAGARNEADAVKRTKRRLHQVFGAYAMEIEPTKALEQLRVAAHAGPDVLRGACADLMSRHASSRERLPILDQFYRDIFAVTGPPARVLDLACGLAPLALPWMGLPPKTVYTACDVDRRLVQIVDGFLTLAGQPHGALLCDVLAAPPASHADVALLLKSAPCLEQQGAGSTALLLQKLDATWIVVSYPTRSLGGAGKGMLATYRRQFTSLATRLDLQAEEVLFPNELVYVVRHARISCTPFPGSVPAAPLCHPERSEGSLSDAATRREMLRSAQHDCGETARSTSVSPSRRTPPFPEALAR